MLPALPISQFPSLPPGQKPAPQQADQSLPASLPSPLVALRGLPAEVRPPTTPLLPQGGPSPPFESPGPWGHQRPWHGVLFLRPWVLWEHPAGQRSASGGATPPSQRIEEVSTPPSLLIVDPSLSDGGSNPQ